MVRRVTDLLSGQRNGPPIEKPLGKILVIKMIEQGATVLASTAIRRAVELVGRENVYFWVFKKNRGILDVMDLIPPENILAVRDDGLFTFAADVWRSLLKIWRAKIDATVDMEFFARAPAALAFLASPHGRRVGLHRFDGEGPYRGDLMTHRVQCNPHLHTAMGYLVLVEALTRPATSPSGKFTLPDADFTPLPFHASALEEEEVFQILKALVGGEVRRPIVLLNPNASDMLPLRRWPTERFVELGKRVLDADANATLVITGAPDEADAARAIAAAISPGRAISVAGSTTLRQLIVLYTMSDALVTNDSGPGHFASLTSLPTLVLFGPETIKLFGPIGTHIRTLSAELACSPCVNALNHRFSPCGDNICMQAISVDDCLQCLLSMIGQPAIAAQRPLVQVTVHVKPKPATVMATAAVN